MRPLCLKRRPECGPCVAYHFESTATLWSKCIGIRFSLLVHRPVR